jgi:hypothetical protein
MFLEERIRKGNLELIRMRWIVGRFWLVGDDLASF